MKILLDECITIKLKSLLGGQEVFSVGQMNWKGMKNGLLLMKAVRENFDLFLTNDKNIIHQQNPSQYYISIVVLNSGNSNIESLQKFIPSFLGRINTFEKGRIYVLESETSA
jgi:predicted nuclease of predicted toxin-antitoxin system